MNQSPNMICCDVYGNRVINEADGFVYVDADGSNNTVGKFEEGTRNVMYKEVVIVGFALLKTFPIFLIKVISKC